MLNLNSPFHFNTHFKVNCVLWVVVFSYVTKKKLAPNHRVYLDSEPQCIMGKDGAFATTAYADMHNVHTNGLYLCVGSTAPSLGILLFAKNLVT